MNGKRGTYGDKKKHELCGRPWSEHTLEKVRGELQWVCPAVRVATQQNM